MAATATSVSGFRNAGFYGMNIQMQNYTASFYYRPTTGAYVAGGRITIRLSDTSGQLTFGLTTIDVSKAPVGVWFNFVFTITAFAAASNTKNVLSVEFPSGSQGDFEFNLISCLPPTFQNRPNGARMDLAQAFADLKPGFVRIPGGNDLEGPSIPERFIWNNTVGALENRAGRRGTWTGYNTEGFGLLELMTLVEDIGATAVLAVYAGYSLNRQAVPLPDLQPYIEEVIREIDFLTASATNNRMGALRAQLGRRNPFDLRYVEIGNEDFIDPAPSTYSYRWPAFYNALSQRYPQITFIATTTRAINPPPAVDDHDYQVPAYFLQNFRRYEKIPRPTPKVLAGEFAVINDDDSKIQNPFGAGRLIYPSVKSAVAESIYRIGFERNSDVIIGGCYAPVLQNVDSTQWTPNLIAFNAGLVVKSTSYLAQKIVGENLGDLLLNSTAANGSMFHHRDIRKGEEGDGKLGNLYFVATKRSSDNKVIVKLASVDQNDIYVQAKIQGSSTSAIGLASILTAGPGVDPATVHNTIDNPNAVGITQVPVSATNGTWSVTVPPWSVVVVTLAL